VPGLGFLFEVTGKPWTAWVGVLGLVFAATIAGLLGFGGGMHHKYENENYNYNYCEYRMFPTYYFVSALCSHCSGSNGERFEYGVDELSTVCQYNDADYCAMVFLKKLFFCSC
jgi:hypothetical protein